MENILETGYANGGFDNGIEIARSTPSRETQNSSKMGNGVDISMTNSEVRTPAVIVRNANKSYKSKRGDSIILNDFNMTVNEGSIYSLLGSSGCGKTTLLSCCVGVKDLDEGEIRIFGAKPGSRKCGVPGRNVGYMPQSLALYPELSIKEILQYFGRIFGMTSSEVNESMEFLVKFLALPPPTSRISILSGGQMRRVSFAVALVHAPRLLILDEPTVGCDPLLRNSIWNHLVKLVSSGRTTVIITTHYIEEARQSNQIGLMRGGKLLAEGSPEALLKLHNTNLLEEIVLKLCLQDNSEEERNSIASTGSLNSGSIRETTTLAFNKTHASSLTFDKSSLLHFQPRRGSTLSNSESFRKTGRIMESLQRISAMTIKNALSLLRNVLFLLFLCFMPALQVIIVCIAIGQDPKGLPFGLINKDTDNPQACYSSSGCFASDNYTGSISCLFLEILDKHGTFDMKYYGTEEEAASDVEQSKSWGYILFYDNYTTSMKDRVLFGTQAEPEAMYGSRIKFRLDQSNLQIFREVSKVFLTSFSQFLKKISGDCDVDPIYAQVPIYFAQPIFGEDSINFTDFLAPSVLLAVLFFFPLCGSGIAYIGEKKSGTLSRCLVAGVTNFEIMVSHLIVQVTTLIVQVVLSFLILSLVFKIHIAGPVFCAFLISVLVGVGGMSMGFLVAAICDEEIQAVLIALAAFVPNMLLSGLLWPVEGMPLYLQRFSYLLPCTWAAEAMRSVLTRGVGYFHPTVWPGFVSIISWIIIYWVLNILVHKLSSRK